MSRAAAWLVGFAVLSAACNGTEPPGAADAGPAVAYRSTLIGDPAPPFEPFHLSLVSPGAEPRRQLRYHVPAGSHQRVQISSDISMEILVAGRRIRKMAPPTTEVSFELDVAPRPGGYRCTAWITGTASADWERMAPGRGSELRKSLEQLRGHRVSFEVDERGVPGEKSIALPDSLEENRSEAFRVLRSVDGAVVPFPEEPVGIGASWTVDMVEPGRSSLAGPVTLTYNLVALRGDQLDVTLGLTLPDEPAPLALEAGVVEGYRSAKSEGVFKIAADLRHLMPEWSGEIANDVEGRSFVGSEELPFTAHSTTRQRIQSR
jgi:hypothetical protein